MLAGSLFVVTYGRSGSSLLQKILNSIDGYKINGENLNGLFFLFKSCQAISRTHETWQGGSPTIPWIGADKIEAERYVAEVVEAFIRRVIRPDENTRVAGFKEIRYVDCTEQDFFGMMNFLLRCFPNAKIVFNTRAAAKVARSGWWRDSEESAVVAMVERMDWWFKRLCEEHPQTCYQVSYDDFTNDPGTLTGLFDFLGEVFDPEKAKDALSVHLDH